MSQWLLGPCGNTRDWSPGLMPSRQTTHWDIPRPYLSLLPYFLSFLYFFLEEWWYWIWIFPVRLRSYSWFCLKVTLYWWCFSSHLWCWWSNWDWLHHKRNSLTPIQSLWPLSLLFLLFIFLWEVFLLLFGSTLLLDRFYNRSNSFVVAERTSQDTRIQLSPES